MSPGRDRQHDARGFSLVEIAIVLAILGLLMRAAVVPLSTIEEVRKRRLTANLLGGARQALIARITSHGALPCPLARVAHSAAGTGLGPDIGPGTGTGIGSGIGSGIGAGPDAGTMAGVCGVDRGALPAAALGLSGATDAGGALLDAWGRPIVYAIAPEPDARGGSPAAVWTMPGAARESGIDALAGALTICREAPRGDCSASAVRAADLVFVLLSHGADASAVGLQATNHRAGLVFTLAPPSAVDAYRFDDQLEWASRSEIVYWLLRSSRLP